MDMNVSGVVGADGVIRAYQAGDMCVFEPREGRVLGDDKNVPEKGADAVSHPSHYTQGGVECIEGIKAALGDEFPAYCQGNVLKYVWRWKLKGGVEDLRKAQVYLGWMIESLGGREMNDLFQEIAARVEHARHKHPVFAEGPFHALGVIESEFRELEYAIEHESKERQRDEAIDVIATCVRFMNGEHEKDLQK